MPKLPDHFAVIDEADPRSPVPTGRGARAQFLNTTFTETPSSRAREVRPTALVHPEDAARLGVTDGGGFGLAMRAARWSCMLALPMECSRA